MTLLYTNQPDSSVRLWDFLLPSLLMIPTGIILLLPSVLISKKTDLSVCEYIMQFKISGRVLMLFYYIYFIISAVYTLSFVKVFLKSMLPEGINTIVMIVCLMGGCVYAGVKGIEASARSALLIVILIITAVILMIVLLMPSYQASNLTRLTGIRSSGLIQSFLLMMSQMAGLSTLTVMTSKLKGNIQRNGTVYIIISSLFTFFMIILLQGTEGDYLQQQRFPVFRSIDGASTLQRFDPLFILIIVCCVFGNISLMLISASSCLSLLTPAFNRNKSVVLGGILLLISIFFLPENLTINEIVPVSVLSCIVLLFFTLIPSGLLLHLYLKKISRKKIIKQAERVSTVVLSVLFLASVCNLHGCTALQLNQRLIVQGIGIDQTDNRYRMTFVILETGNTEEPNKSIILYSEGERPETAMLKLEKEKGKKLLLNQCVFVMMNQRAAEMAEVSLYPLTESNDIPKTVSLLVSLPESEDVIKKAMLDYGYSSEDINAVTDSKAIPQQKDHCTLLDFIASKSQPKSKLRIPVIRANNDTDSISVQQSLCIYTNLSKTTE